MKVMIRKIQESFFLFYDKFVNPGHTHTHNLRASPATIKRIFLWKISLLVPERKEEKKQT